MNHAKMEGEKPKGVFMIIICGASASGKTAVLKALSKKYYYQKMVTTTTRPKRPLEVDGKDYHFLDSKAFENIQKENGFIETTRYNQESYGTQKKYIKARMAVILDPKGVNAFFEKRPHKDFIVFFKTPKEVRKERMLLRGDDLARIEERLLNDDQIFDLNQLSHVDLIIENTDQTIEHMALEIHLEYRRFQNEIRTQKR
jgi:guanylate kinase